MDVSYIATTQVLLSKIFFVGMYPPKLLPTRCKVFLPSVLLLTFSNSHLCSTIGFYPFLTFLGLLKVAFGLLCRDLKVISGFLSLLRMLRLSACLLNILMLIRNSWVRYCPTESVHRTPTCANVNYSMLKLDCNAV